MEVVDLETSSASFGAPSDEDNDNKHEKWNGSVLLVYRMFLGHTLFCASIMLVTIVFYMLHLSFIPSVILLSVGIPIVLILLVLLDTNKESQIILGAFNASLGVVIGGGVTGLTQSAGAIFFLLAVMMQCASVIALCVYSKHKVFSVHMTLGFLAGGTILGVSPWMIIYCSLIAKSFVSLVIVQTLACITLVYHVYQVRLGLRRTPQEVWISVVRIYTDPLMCFNFQSI